jgi:uncharacterized protein
LSRAVPAGAHHAIHVDEVNEAMSLKAQLEDEHKQAMKRRDQRTADVIRMIKAKITERGGGIGASGEVEDAAVIEAIASYRKLLKNSLDAFHQAGTQGEEHADALIFEIAFCERFLPAALDEAALRALVGERIAALGITDMKQSGKLIGDIMKTHKGLAEAAEIRRIAEEILKPTPFKVVIGPPFRRGLGP